MNDANISERDEFNTPAWRIVGTMIQGIGFLLGLLVFFITGYSAGCVVRAFL